MRGGRIEVDEIHIRMEAGPTVSEGDDEERREETVSEQNHAQSDADHPLATTT